MNEHLIQQKFDEIKPGESLHTSEWKKWWLPQNGKVRSNRELEEYGFATMLILLMHMRGWRTADNLPDVDELAHVLWCAPAKVSYLLPAFQRVPSTVLQAELQRIRRWPGWIVKELAP